MFNFKKAKGFTLIELLIVVAIIGILAALLIPNALTAMQKARQKSGMKEIMTISTGAMDYITDNSSWLAVTQTGVLVQNAGIIPALAPFYIRNVPVNDPWNTPYEVYCGITALTGRIGDVPADMLGDDDFLVLSHGRGGTTQPGTYLVAGYTIANPDASLYTVSSMSDFNNQLAAWSGTWVVAPRTTAEATTT